MLGINNFEDSIYLLLPLISGYSISLFCGPDKKSGSIVKFRPPGWVFGIVWTILYLLTGLAWVNSKQLTIYFIILILLLCSWLIIYGCKKNKIGGIYILFLSLMTSLFIYTNVNYFSKNLMIPLIIWLLFATFLNIFEVQTM